MTLSGEVTFGNVLTILSVLISALALAYGWRKDRQLRRTEYADRVRRATGVVAAKLDRWPAVVLQFFDDLQPLLLEVDHLRDHDQSDDEALHLLQRGLYEQRAVASQRIAAEEIESAYVDLYGYDPRIHELFRAAVARIRAIDQRTFGRVRELARGEPAAAIGGQPEPGETMQQQMAALARAYERQTDEVVDAFRAEMLKLIQADDDQILRRGVAFSSAAEALPAASREVEESRGS